MRGIKKMLFKKKSLFMILIILMVFMPLTLNALETKVIPQLTFIGFEEHGNEIVAVINYGDEDKHLNIGDTVGERKLIDMNFEENEITFKRNKLTSTLKRGHSFHRVFVQSWAPKKEEERVNDEVVEYDYDFSGTDYGNIGPIEVDGSFHVEYKADEPTDMGTASFQIFYEGPTGITGVAANTFAPTEGSYYIGEPGEYVFEINTFGGVNWHINIVEI